MSAELFPSQFELPAKRYLTTSEAAKFCRLSVSTLRYWATLFPMLQPGKRSGRFYYRNEDIETVLKIDHLVGHHGYKLGKARVISGFSYSSKPPNSPRLSSAVFSFLISSSSAPANYWKDRF